VKIRLKIPARINILGNPSDGVEGDFATITAAVNIYAYAEVEPASRIIFEIAQDRTHLEKEAGSEFTTNRQVYEVGSFPLPYDGSLDLLKGAYNRLYKFSPEFRDKSDKRGVKITSWSEVPLQSGLGGSSLLVILALVGLREFYQLDKNVLNDYVLAELTQRVEAKELNITCGYADRYMPIFGGIAYLDYRGKLQQKDIFQEPFVTVETLDKWVQDLPIMAITTGIKHDSGDVHGCMRPKYLKQEKDWMHKGGNFPIMVRFMQGAWETAWRGKMALLHNDLPAFGELMNKNHALVEEMMKYCGFKDGAGWANNLFIQMALSSEALGAKLTGAGGGGSVYALVKPGDEEKLEKVWKETARKHQLSEAKIFRPHICKEGLTIQNVS
jgi:galactokinase/mevalonate kinase-like predicted kinase